MAKSNFIVRGGADFSNLYNGFATVQKRMTAFQTGINRTLKGIGTILSSLAIGKLIKDSTAMAMSVESSMDNISRNMKSSAGAFQNWIETQSKSLGMGKAEAYKYGATFSNLLDGFLTDAKQTAKGTEDLMKASAIISSKTGRSFDDVSDRIRSGMLGSTEAIEDLGVYVQVSMLESTAAFRKFAGDKSWAQLDYQTQQQIRLQAILEQAYKRYGNTLADTTQTRQAQFLASLKNIQLWLGKAFLPIYNAVLPSLTAMADAIGRVVSVFAQFTQALFGKPKQQVQQTDAVTQQSGAVEDLGDAYKAAGKEAKKSVANFDEVNQLAKNSESSAAPKMDNITSATGAMPLNFETNAPTISTKVQEMADKVKSAFTKMKNAVVENKDIIIPAIGAIVGAMAGLAAYNGILTLIDTFKKLGATIKTTWAFLAANPVLLAVAAIGALIGALVAAYLTNDEFRARVDKLWETIKTALTPAIEKLGDILTWVWNNVMVPVGKFIAGVFVSAWKGLGNVVKWVRDNIFVPFGDFLKWLWKSVLVPIGGILIDMLGVAFSTVAKIAESFWKNVLVPLGQALKEMFGPAVEAVSAELSFLWKSVFVPFVSFIASICKPIIEALIKVFEFLWKNVLKPIIVFMGGEFINAFDRVFITIGDIIKGFKEIFIGLMTFITGVFTGDWRKAWEGIKQIFKGVWDTFYGIVKYPLNLIIDAINLVIKGLNKISIKVPDWVPGLGGNKWGINIAKIPRLATGGITDGPTLAMVGDNPGGREVVSPLDDLVEMIQQAVQNAGGNGDLNLTIKIGEDTITQKVISNINRQNRISGKTVITV